MMQHVGEHEQLLSFLYGELSIEEAATFQDHLAGCGACQKELGQHRLVRAAFRALPEVAPEEGDLVRMTAGLLQAAAQRTTAATAAEETGATVGAPFGADGVNGATRKTTMSGESSPRAQHAVDGPDGPDGRGKVLPLRRRKLLSYLFHPGTGVMAAAAMALFFVVVRKEAFVPLQREARVAPPATISAPIPQPDKALKEEATSLKTATGEKNRVAPLTVPTGGTGNEVPESARLVAKKPVAVPRKAPAPPPVAHGKGGKQDPSQELGPSGEEQVLTQAPATPSVSTVAAAPPPQAAPTQQLAQKTQPGYFPADSQAGGAAPSQQAPRPNSASQVGGEAQVLAEVNQALRQRTQGAQREDLNRALGDTGHRAQSQRAGADAPLQGLDGEGDPPDNASPLLGRLREDLRAGRCKEATEVMGKLLKTQRDLVSREDLLAYQQTCSPRQETKAPDSQDKKRSKAKK